MINHFQDQLQNTYGSKEIVNVILTLLGTGIRYKNTCTACTDVDIGTETYYMYCGIEMIRLDYMSTLVDEHFDTLHVLICAC